MSYKVPRRMPIAVGATLVLVGALLGPVASSHAASCGALTREGEKGPEQVFVEAEGTDCATARRVLFDQLDAERQGWECLSAGQEAECVRGEVRVSYRGGRLPGPAETGRARLLLGEPWSPGLFDRPDTITLDLSSYVTGLRWSSWGGPVATGNGRFEDLDAEPQRDTTAAVNLGRRRPCGPFRIYTAVSIEYADGRAPARLEQPCTARMLLPSCCSDSGWTLSGPAGPRRIGYEDLKIRVRWRRWGRAVARGRGRFQECATRGLGPCERTVRGRIRLILSDAAFCRIDNSHSADDGTDWVSGVVYRREVRRMTVRGRTTTKTYRHRQTCAG